MFVIPFRRRWRLPRVWAPDSRRGGVTPADVRIMIWLGLLLGLLCYQALRLLPPTDGISALPVAADVRDPYEESRRSRAILEAQEAAPAPVPLQSSAERGAAAAVRVIDGDTFDHAGVRIRIADIDTPELRGRCAYEIELAGRARNRLRTLLATAAFELHPLPEGRDEDRHGRKLRIVTQRGRSVGDVLVAEGLARTWTGRREAWCV